MAQVRDVVCGMMEDSETAKFKSDYQGQSYYFCASGCKVAFDKEPEKYVQHEQGGHDEHGHLSD